jgi:hypothetical protein
MLQRRRAPPPRPRPRRRGNSPPPPFSADLDWRSAGLACCSKRPTCCPRSLELSHLSADAFLDTRIARSLNGSSPLISLSSHQNERDLEARSVLPTLALTASARSCRISAPETTGRAADSAADCRLDAFKMRHYTSQKPPCAIDPRIAFMQQDAHDAGDAERMRELSVLIEQCGANAFKLISVYNAVTCRGRRKPGRQRIENKRKPSDGAECQRFDRDKRIDGLLAKGIRRITLPRATLSLPFRRSATRMRSTRWSMCSARWHPVVDDEDTRRRSEGEEPS